MTLDHQPQRYGALNFDHMSSYHAPSFTNPWASASSPPNPSQGMYQQPLSGLDILAKQHPSRTSAPSSSMASFGSIPVTAASADLLNLNRMQTTSAAYGEPAYATTSAPSVHSTYAASPPSFEHGLPGYAAAPVRSTFALAPEADHRRYSHSSVPSSVSSSDFGTDDGLHSSRSSVVDFPQRGIQQDDRRSFADALDAGHGMLAMSQETPRAIYPPRARGSADSYGFPSTHSTSSSISSASNYGSGSYYGGSMDSSVSDYSTAGSDIESVTSRTLPRPTNLMTQPPPAPQSMMGQFSSKVSSSTQKKHKCKVCDKRFTRPSSLQTHMYSHTGEKPFSCEVEGCGRHFSVVSNLRRHRKVHKNDAKSDAGSEDHNDESD